MLRAVVGSTAAPPAGRIAASSLAAAALLAAVALLAGTAVTAGAQAASTPGRADGAAPARGAAADGVDGETRRGPAVVIQDPADDGSLHPDEDPRLFTAETLAYREYLQSLERLPEELGENVGGEALIGLNVGGRRHLRGRFVDELARERLESWDGRGAAVLRVFPGSPGDEAWLEPGDVIVRFSGLWIDSSDTLIRMATRAEPGREYEAWYLRDGQVYKTWVVPGTRDDVRTPAMEAAGERVVPAGARGLVMPKLLEAPEADYPRDALTARRGGTATIRVVVDDEGRVSEASVSEETGVPELDAAALEAVAGRLYAPGRLRATPVGVAMKVRVHFVPPGVPVEELVPPQPTGPPADVQLFDGF